MSGITTGPIDLSSIVDARIHPAIGIARVGNSLDEFFLGPELPNPLGPPPGGYRDAQGRLKRQAARFRIFGYDKFGNVVGELNASNADIEWTVHVANKKAGWYQYDMPLDLRPEATDVQSARRNSTIGLSERGNLAIDPGPRTIPGKPQAPPVCFDTGKFFGTPVYLGELQTDAAGRLLFLGGRGKAGSPFLGYTLVTFGNNPGWYDDVSDGPVDATVTINGKPIPVDAAWVVTAPPAYAPDIVSPVTMFDLIYDAIAGANFPARTKPRFTQEILPILRGLVDFQWVNTGFFFQFGWRGPWEFTRPDFVSRLAAPGNQFQELRRQVFQMFRNPSTTVPFQALTWPQLYGDGLGIAANGVESPRNGMAVTGTQYEYLSQWVSGDFEANYDPNAKPPQSLDEVGLQDQPDTLDRAALTYCLGGPFHPGNEMTWPMRRYSMYRGKFRLRRHPEGWAYPDYGDFLNQTTVLAPSGPLAASGPGDITRWMSVPWHADTASCQQGYPGFENASLFNQDPFLPSFWPSRSPNEVLAEEDYRIVIDQSQPIADRIAAFNRRKDWIRTLGPLTMPYVAQITKMVAIFDQMGVVEQRPGVANDPNFPAVMYVEALGAPQGEQTMKAVVGGAPTPPVVQAPEPEPRPEAPATMSRAFLQMRFGGRRRP